MLNWLKKEAVREIVDPQLEFARLARQQGGHQREGDHPPSDPPAAVDSDFCYHEEAKK